MRDLLCDLGSVFEEREKEMKLSILSCCNLYYIWKGLFLCFFIVWKCFGVLERCEIFCKNVVCELVWGWGWYVENVEDL